MENNVYLSFYLGSYTIRIFKDAIRKLQTPRFIQIQIHKDGHSLMIAPSNVNSLTTFRVPKNIYQDNGNMEVHSYGLCRIIAEKLHGDITRSYRVPGYYIPEKGVAIFQLTKAELIPSTSSPYN